MERAYRARNGRALVSPTIVFEDDFIRFAGTWFDSDEQELVDRFIGYPRDVVHGSEPAEVMAGSTACCIVPSAVEAAGGFTRSYLGGRRQGARPLPQAAARRNHVRLAAGCRDDFGRRRSQRVQPADAPSGAANRPLELRPEVVAPRQQHEVITMPKTLPSRSGRVARPPRVSRSAARRSPPTTCIRGSTRPMEAESRFLARVGYPVVRHSGTALMSLRQKGGVYPLPCR